MTGRPLLLAVRPVAWYLIAPLLMGIIGYIAAYVWPAGVDTGFVPGRTREQLQKIAESFPLAHLTTPDEVARAVIACIVNLTSSTGIVVPVDEGRHL